MKPCTAFVLGVLASAIGGCAAPSISPSPEERQALAPTGKLRVGINVGNAVLAKRDAATGEITGITVDLGRELAKRLGAQFVAVTYDGPGELVKGARAGEWDIGFSAVDAARADVLHFTRPYMEVSNTYLVPKGSPIRSAAEADRPGVRIGVGAKNAADLFLSRTLKNARLIRIPEQSGAVELLQSGKADIFASSRERLQELQKTLDGSRVLDDRFHAVEHAMAVPRGKEPALGYVRAFVEDVKASGFVSRAIARHAIRGVEVAPVASP